MNDEWALWRERGYPDANRADSGLHPLGCYFGGPEGERYWTAVLGCPLVHDDGDLAPLRMPSERVHASWEHLRAAGLLATGESA